MAIPNVSVTYTSVLLAAVASFIIGALWYGPIFGKKWMKLSGMTAKDVKAAKKKGMGKLYFINFIGTLITAYVLGVFLGFSNAVTVAEATMVAFWAWLGFFASTTLLGSVLWENRPIGLYVLNAGYWLVNLIVIAIVVLTV